MLCNKSIRHNVFVYRIINSYNIIYTLKCIVIIYVIILFHLSRFSNS